MRLLLEPVDQHLRALAAGAVDRNARQALQRLGDFLVGHLAEIFRHDGLDRLVWSCACDSAPFPAIRESR